MVGARLNRGLWYLERHGSVRCPICSETHAHHDPARSYRAVEVASEPITDEDLCEVPNGTVYVVDPQFRLCTEPMGLFGLQAAGAVTTEPRPVGLDRGGT
jgi:hypothetical protein